jgi:hypothetical protein
MHRSTNVNQMKQEIAALDAKVTALQQLVENSGTSDACACNCHPFMLF